MMLNNGVNIICVKNMSSLFRMPMPNNVECRDITQQWLHNIGMGYMLKTFHLVVIYSFVKTTLKTPSKVIL